MTGPAVDLLPAVLAQETTPANPSAGYVALLLIVLIGLVTVLLIRNMSGRLKRLPRQFPEPSERQADDEPRDRPGPDAPTR